MVQIPYLFSEKFGFGEVEQIAAFLGGNSGRGSGKRK